jgi:hypothetical protein
MSKVLVISTSLRAKKQFGYFAGSLFCGGISDPGEADRKDTEKNEAYQFGKALE